MFWCLWWFQLLFLPHSYTLGVYSPHISWVDKQDADICGKEEESLFLEGRFQLPTSKRVWAVHSWKAGKKHGKGSACRVYSSASPSPLLALGTNTHCHQAWAFKSFPCQNSRIICWIDAKGSTDVRGHWEADPTGYPCIYTLQRIWPLLGYTSKGDYCFRLPQAEHS